MNNKENNKKNIEIIFDDEENTNYSSEKVKQTQNKRPNRRKNLAKGTKSKENKKNNKKKMPRKKKIIIVLSIFLGIILLLGTVFGVYLIKAKGNLKEAVLDIATDIVGDQDPIFVLILGVSEDISAKLTDTIMLCGYNPSTQKAFMLSVPRDTFVGKSESSANGYDKINAQFQKSAEKTVESVELLTGVKIDYYVIVRNISITSIFECFGSVDFDVPINMDYDDPTQDLHIHLKKGYQTLQPNQIEQLLRFRHNNDGTSYPSSYGDNDYGRMRTQREFIKAAMEQVISIQNVSKLKNLASMVYTNLQTNMSGYTVLDYVPHALKFNTSNLRSEQLPGQSAMINNLWFYQASKSKTKSLLDELMIYLELDNKTLDSHYKYASDIKGVKPDQNWVANEVVIDDDVSSSTNKVKDNEVINPEKCKHKYAIESNTATCEKGGTITYKCTICGKEKYENVGPLGHEYDSNGVCIRCSKQKKVEPKECDHNWKTVVTKEATCEDNGSKYEECTKCHEKTDVKSTDKLGHSFGAWKTVTQPTTSSDGLKERECSRCHKKETQKIDKLQQSTTPEPSKPTNTTPTPPTNTAGDETDNTVENSGSTGSSGNPNSGNNNNPNENDDNGGTEKEDGLS